MKITYAYPSSPRGGRSGVYYVETDTKIIGFATVEQAVNYAITRTDHLVIDFGVPEKADKWRHLGVVHSLDH